MLGQPPPLPAPREEMLEEREEKEAFSPKTKYLKEKRARTRSSECTGAETRTLETRMLEMKMFKMRMLETRTLEMRTFSTRGGADFWDLPTPGVLG